MDNEQRITALEARIAALEARIANLEKPITRTPTPFMPPFDNWRVIGPGLQQTPPQVPPWTVTCGDALMQNKAA